MREDLLVHLFTTHYCVNCQSSYNSTAFLKLLFGPVSLLVRVYFFVLRTVFYGLVSSFATDHLFLMSYTLLVVFPSLSCSIATTLTPQQNIGITRTSLYSGVPPWKTTKSSRRLAEANTVKSMRYVVTPAIIEVCRACKLSIPASASSKC